MRRERRTGLRRGENRFRGEQRREKGLRKGENRFEERRKSILGLKKIKKNVVRKIIYKKR